MATAQPQPRVQAVHCDHMSDDEAIYAALRRATMPLQAAWSRLRAAKRIALQDGEVRWHNTSSDLRASRRKLARNRHSHAMWLKYVDPEEAEGEHYEVYKQALAQIVEAGL